MGLSDGTAIVTVTEVAEITGEDGLPNLAPGGSSATIDNACKWATSWLMDELDARGIPPAKIANPERLKRAAAFYAASRLLRSDGVSDESIKKADEYLAEARDLVQKYRFVSSDAPGDGTTNLMLPALGNQDASAVFGPTRPGDLNPAYPPPFLS